jgi:hypothetical protein
LGIHFDLPLDKHVILLFLAHLFDTGKKYSTILGYLSALNYNLKMRSFSGCSNSFVISKFLVGIKNLSPPAAALLPISKEILGKLVGTLGSQYEGKLLRSLFSFMYFACLRIGEVALSGHGDHIINIGQVNFKGKNNVIQSLSLDFDSYKCSGGKTPSLILVRNENIEICPIFNLLQFLNVRPNKDGPLFVQRDGTILTRNWILTRLKLHLNLIGVQNKQYNTHSFRIGRATDLAADGSSDRHIQRIGRWSSDAFRRYIRPSVVSA